MLLLLSLLSLCQCAVSSPPRAVTLDFRALDYGADHSSDTPVISATKAGHVAELAALLDGGADVNARNAFGMTALHVALYPHETGGFLEEAEAHREEIVHELLEAGADLHVEDGFFLTPLQLAHNAHLDNKVWVNYYSQKYYHSVWDLRVRERSEASPLALRPQRPRPFALQFL
jgi:ankyrin repeat protein